MGEDSDGHFALLTDIERAMSQMHCEQPRPAWEEAVARLQAKKYADSRTGEAIDLADDEGREWIESVLFEIGEPWDEDWEGEVDDSPWAGRAPPLRRGLAPGSPITLTGLASKPELNGRAGWSLGIHPTSQRCMVQLQPLPGEEGAPPAPFSVRPECVDGGEEPPPPDLSGVAKHISDEEIALRLAGSACADERTVEGTKRAIAAAQTVAQRFFYGPGGPGALDAAAAKRMDYVRGVFGSAERIRWWVDQVAASGAPDFVCEHTTEEVHFYVLDARQIAAFVRTGYDPKAGALPERLASRLRLGEY